MSEYISREAALSEACKGCGIDFPCDPCEPQDCEIKARLEAIPAADVVEVVRCRECVYWRGENDICKGICIDFSADGYCSEGKRKDGGQDDD